MKRSSKKVIVALLLITMLSQTLYSAAAGFFGLGTQKYAYADDEVTEEVDPGEEVDASTQDDGTEAPGEVSEEPSTEQYIQEEGTEETRDVPPEVRLQIAYENADGSAIKDTEDYEESPGYIYVLKNEAPEIEDYTYSKTTINIEETDRDITAVFSEDKEGVRVYSVTEDEDVENKNFEDIAWTELTADNVIVMHYDAVEEESEEPEEEVTEEATEETSEKKTDEEGTSDTEEKTDEEKATEEVSENEAEGSEEEAVKRVYEYEDSNIYAKATLEKADAIPDDAVFVVKDVTGSSDADDAVEKADGATDTELDKEKARVYDIHFENDELGEIEPEEGSVTIEIRFKKSIIAPEGEEEAGDRAVILVHVSDDGEASEVEADIADGGSGVTSVSFDTDSLSLYVCATNAEVKAGTSRSVASILGRAQYYGITANKVTLAGHVDSNMAVGELNTNNNTTQGAYTGSGNPGNDIIASYIGSTWYADV
ncbi:MAG: hypothetical protein K6G42_02620, partial [Lachnospiraceae bacterium]|nr:hypothetical protein [Lachnospiraceae bacterium]